MLQITTLRHTDANLVTQVHMANVAELGFEQKQSGFKTPVNLITLNAILLYICEIGIVNRLYHSSS